MIDRPQAARNSDEALERPVTNWTRKKVTTAYLRPLRSGRGCGVYFLPRGAQRNGGGGPAEGRWRGPLAVQDSPDGPEPPPPCFAWSPSPASRGRRGARRRTPTLNPAA